MKQGTERRTGGLDAAVLEVVQRDAALGGGDVVDAIDEILHRLLFRPQHFRSENAVGR